MIAGNTIAIMAILGLPSARITLFDIMAQARKGVPNNITLKYTFAGTSIVPLPPNAESTLS